MEQVKLFVETAIVFFGTLLAAALVALGDPGRLELQMAAPSVAVAALLDFVGLR